jgi:hypothetical protein
VSGRYSSAIVAVLAFQEDLKVINEREFVASEVIMLLVWSNRHGQVSVPMVG